MDTRKYYTHSHKWVALLLRLLSLTQISGRYGQSTKNIFSNVCLSVCVTLCLCLSSICLSVCVCLSMCMWTRPQFASCLSFSDLQAIHWTVMSTCLQQYHPSSPFDGRHLYPGFIEDQRCNSRNTTGRGRHRCPGFIVSAPHRCRRPVTTQLLPFSHKSANP